MKKNIGIIIILVILWIWLGYLAYKTNIQEEEIAINPETIAFTTNWTWVLSTWNNLSGDVINSLSGDFYKNIRKQLVTGTRKASRNPNNANQEYCSREIWDIESLAKNISSYTGKTIDKLTIKDACGKTRVLTSSITHKVDSFLSGEKYLNITQEDDKYIIYSLIDDNNDLPVIEYPVIVYNKMDKTNTLITISYRIFEINYLDNEWYFIIKIYGYEDDNTTEILLKINEDKILWTFSTLWQDCWNQWLLDKNNHSIILHNFNIEQCWYDSDPADAKRESKLIWKLTYEPLSTPLWDFNKDSKLYRTNEDIVESAKNDTTIFHIDDTQYEIKNNTLIKR